LPEISHSISVSSRLSYVYRSAKFFNRFARLFILFYHSPTYETFRTKSKQASEKVEKFRRSVNVA